METATAEKIAVFAGILKNTAQESTNKAFTTTPREASIEDFSPIVANVNMNATKIVVLDGGASTQLYANGSMRIYGGRAVHSIIEIK